MSNFSLMAASSLVVLNGDILMNSRAPVVLIKCVLLADDSAKILRCFNKEPYCAY